MRIPSNVCKCVAFVAFENKHTGALAPVGSVFFVGEGVQDGTAKIAFAVTAKHVIDGLRSKGVDTVYILANTIAGEKTEAATSIDDWFSHPTNESIDVAIIAFTIPASWDHLLLSVDSFATPELLTKQEVDLGDAVFVTGLFTRHTGLKKNVPIVRTGNLAAFDEEPIQTRSFGDIAGYLIEARSIGGLSGSPVFLNLGHVRLIDGTVKFWNASLPSFSLLGLVHGHYDVDAVALDSDTAEDKAGLSVEKINTGIAIVVPFYSILDVLRNHPLLVMAAGS